MISNRVWIPVNRDAVDGKKILTSTWVMKKKANGRLREKLNARGYEQEQGVHYKMNEIAAPVVNETTIKVLFVLMLLANWTAHIVDVQGAFLKGRFHNDEQLYMEVPEGFEKYYTGNVVLKLQRVITD